MMAFLEIIFLIVLAYSNLNKVSAEVYYEAVILGEIGSCEGFTNEIVITTGLKVLTVKGVDDDESHLVLGGYINITNELAGDYEVTVEIAKETEQGNIVMFTMAGTLDNLIKDEDAPWAPLCSDMGITGCPILAGQYVIAEFKVSLSSAKSVMNHEYVGSWLSKLTIATLTDTFSCHILSFAIEEKNDDD